MPTYKDGWVKIVGSLIVSLTVDSMGRRNSIFERLSEGYFYIDIFAGFITTLIIWESIRRITIWLDKNHDWIEKPLERFLLQMVLGVVIPIFLSFSLVMSYLKFAWDQDIFKTEWLYYEMYMVIFIILIINFIYFSWWLYLKYTEKALGITAASYPPFPDSLPIREKVTAIQVSKAGKNRPPSATDPTISIDLSGSSLYIHSKYAMKAFIPSPTRGLC